MSYIYYTVIKGKFNILGLRIMGYFDIESLEEEDEYLLDEINGSRKKPVMSILNKRKLSKDEMDGLFLKEVP